MYVRHVRHHNGGVSFGGPGGGVPGRRYEVQLHDVEGAHYATGSLYSVKRASYPRIEPEQWWLFQLRVKDNTIVVRVQRRHGAGVRSAGVPDRRADRLAGAQRRPLDPVQTNQGAPDLNAPWRAAVASAVTPRRRMLPDKLLGRTRDRDESACRIDRLRQRPDAVGAAGAAPGTGTNPLKDTAAAAVEGRALYAKTCQSCHGPAGEGSDRGPSLRGRLTHGNADADLFRAIRRGVPGTQMPPFAAALSDTRRGSSSRCANLQGQPRRNAAQVRRRGGGRSAVLRPGRLRELSQVNGRGGVVGPDLSRPDDFSSRAAPKIVDPNAAPAGAAGGRGGRGAGPVRDRRADAPTAARCAASAGTRTRSRCRWWTSSGQLHLLDKLRLASVAALNKSLHPTDYATRLSAAEIANLVAYLGTLKGRDPARPLPRRRCRAASPTSGCSTREPNRTTG